MATNTSVRMSATGKSAWIPVNRHQDAANVALAVTLSEGATLTYSVQHTLDRLNRPEYCSISRSTTTATLTQTGIGKKAAVGDCVVVSGAGAPLDGTYDVASVTGDDALTYTVADSGVSVSHPSARVSLLRVLTHDDLSGETAADDGNYAFPPAAIRLYVSDYTDGYAELTVNQGS